MANVKIKQLPSGNFNAMVYDRTVDGKRKYKSITASTKSEVKRQIAVFLATREEQHAEAERLESFGASTVGDAIDKYIASKSNILSPSTTREYNQLRRNSFASIIDMPLAELTSDDVQRAVNEESATHAPKTVRNKHGLLASALAVYAPNLKLNTTLPRRVKPDITIPDAAEMRKIFAEAKGNTVEPAIYLAAMCGMRRSEIAALKWSDVDIVGGTLTIRSAKVKGDDGDYVIKATKTTAGKRDIKIFAPVLSILKSLEQSGEYVCPLTPSTISDRFITILKRSGVRHFRFHDLRHYCVSVMLSLNMPKKYIADYVGHETERMIDEVYGHVMHDAKENFLTAVEGYFVLQMQDEMQDKI